MKKTVLIVSLFWGLVCSGQQIRLLNSQKSDVSFRGLSVVNDSTFWVSGTSGTVGLTTDGGKTFEWLNPEGFGERDFRSVTGFDRLTAVVMAIGSPAVVLRTDDGGKSWKEVYRDGHPDVFLDDMSFYEANPTIGFAVGDPVEGNAYFLKTTDGGLSWQKIDPAELPDLDEGEAFFAASDSNLKLTGPESFFAVSGGSTSDLIHKGSDHYKISLPKTDSGTSGANGLDYSKELNLGLIVGGDFMNPKASDYNLFIFELNREGIPLVKRPVRSPSGYKSGVIILRDGSAVSCGVLNVDYSKDRGRTWETISKQGFHTCKRSNTGNRVYLAGAEGRIAVLVD